MGEKQKRHGKNKRASLCGLIAVVFATDTGADIPRLTSLLLMLVSPTRLELPRLTPSKLPTRRKQ